MKIKPTTDTTIISTLVIGMLKPHWISGDSKEHGPDNCSGL